MSIWYCEKCKKVMGPTPYARCGECGEGLQRLEFPVDPDSPASEWLTNATANASGDMSDEDITNVVIYHKKKKVVR